MKIRYENYRHRKEEIDDFCKRVGCGYEIFRDGSAVVIID